MVSRKDHIETLEILNLSIKYWEMKDAIKELEMDIIFKIEQQKERRKREGE